MKCFLVLAGFLTCFAGDLLRAEDGYDLWLRYNPLPPGTVAAYQSRAEAVMAPGDSATATAIRKELVAGCSGLLGHPVSAVDQVDRDGIVMAGTPGSLPAIAGLPLAEPLARLGPEGFLIRSVKIHGHAATVIASITDLGALYGTFHFLRLMQTLQPIDKLDVSEKPRLKLRLLDHWDNLDGSIERGYAGRSLWDWKALPDTVDSFSAADADIAAD